MYLQFTSGSFKANGTKFRSNILQMFTSFLDSKVLSNILYKVGLKRRKKESLNQNRRFCSVSISLSYTADIYINKF